MHLYRPTVSSSQTIFAKSISDNGGPFAEGTPLIGKADRADAYLYLSCAVQFHWTRILAAIVQVWREMVEVSKKQKVKF